MEEKKSMGSALVDVFDAGVTLAKSEINAVTRKAGQMAKAKGLGAMLLLAALGPLMLGLIFLLLAFVYALLIYARWNAFWVSVLLAVVSLGLTAVLAFMGLRKLSAEVPLDEPLIRREPAPLGDGADSVSPRPVQPVSPSLAERMDGLARPAQTPVTAQPTSASSSSGLQDIQWRDAQNRKVVTLRETPGIPVTTDPTYAKDMNRGEA